MNTLRAAAHRATWMAASAALCALMSCAPDKGTARLRFEWVDGEPDLGAAPFLFLSVEERSNPDQPGSVLRLEGPIAYFDGAQVALRSVPNGDDRVVIAEFHDSRWRNSRVLYYGRSDPFRLEAGRSFDVVVRIRAGESPTPLPGGPTAPHTDRVVLRRAPWGTDGDPAGRQTIVGDPGAVAAGVRVVAFNAAEVLRATELGETQASTDGSFRIDLVTPTATGRVYVATADADDNLSDSGEGRGLQASLVASVEWIASLNGKVAGSAFPNPHRVITTPDTVSTLRQPTSVISEADQAGIDAMISVDDDSLTVASQRRWIEIPASTPPVTRVAAAMAFDRARGRAVLFGGFRLNGSADLADTWEWDGRTWTQVVPRGEAPLPRAGHAMIYHAALGRTLLFGGSVVSQTDASNELWSWDAERWTLLNPPGPRPPKMYDHGMAYDEARGRLVVFGGCTNFEACQPMQPDVWEFDGERWHVIARQPVWPELRRSAVAVYDRRRQQTIVFGGADRNDDTVDTLWAWDGQRWTELQQGGQPPSTPVGMAADYDEASERVVAFGGWSTINPGPTGTATRGEDLWAWNGEAWARLARGTDQRPPPRSRATIVFDSVRGETVMFGGASLDRDGRTWIWSEGWSARGRVADKPTARGRMAMVYDPDRGRLVAFGGLTSSAIVGETWERQAGLWRRIAATPTDPPARFGASMAYDRDRQQIVLFGGEGVIEGVEQVLNDTWVRAGATWTRVHDGGNDAPPPRRGAAVAFDESTGQVVLFGGTNDEQLFADTWLWNGDTDSWVQAQTVGQPDPRKFAHMTYDPDRRVIVMVAGEGNDRTALADHWEFRAGNWRRVRRSVAGLGRTDGAMVYDRVRQRLVVVAGGVPAADDGIAVEFNDVFEYDGRDWQFITPSRTRPAPRTGVAAVYDESLGRTVIFGGFGGASVQVFDDTWAWNGSQWEALDALAINPGPRCAHAMTYLPEQGYGLLYGGCIDGSCRPGTGDTWQFDRAGWRPRASEGAAPVTLAHALAQAPGGALLFGGDRTAEGLFSFDPVTAWRWDGQDWTLAFSAPFFLRDVAAVFDTRRRRTVIFGGFSLREGGRPSLELLEWTGEALERRTGGSTPPPRASHAMAYDESRGVTVVHGGRDAVGTVDDRFPRALGDTWEWDGESWTLRAGGQQGPGRRDGHRMAYDSTRGRTVLVFGRNDDFVVQADAWEWNGEAWRQLDFAGTTPAARVESSLIFDPQQQAFVLYGGSFRDTCFPDTWLLRSDPEQRPAIIVSIDFRASGEGAAAVRQVTLRAVGGGQGYTTTVPGVGDVEEGLTAEAWNAWASRWEPFGALPSGSTVLGALVFATQGAEQARRLVTGDGLIHFRLTPTRGIGNGPAPARVTLDAVEVEVTYQLSDR